LSTAGRHLLAHGFSVYPVPQNALYVSAGMNVLKFPKGKP